MNNVKIKGKIKIKLIGSVSGKSVLESILPSQKDCHEVINSFKESMKVKGYKIYDNTIS